MLCHCDGQVFQNVPDGIAALPKVVGGTYIKSRNVLLTVLETESKIKVLAFSV